MPIIEAVRKKNGEISSRALCLAAATKPAHPRGHRVLQAQNNWSNRLIAGDSLLVMNSLIEKEGMAGKSGRWSTSTRLCMAQEHSNLPTSREVKDGKDEDLTQEPETIRASATPPELRIHPYLASAPAAVAARPAVRYRVSTARLVLVSVLIERCTSFARLQETYSPRLTSARQGMG